MCKITTIYKETRTTTIFIEIDEEDNESIVGQFQMDEISAL